MPKYLDSTHHCTRCSGTVSLFGNRTLCHPIQSVIIPHHTPATQLSEFVNHMYDYRLNWTPLSPITIIK